MKIGRHRIAFGGRTFWTKPQVPTTVRRFLCFWILKEVRAMPWDIDKERQFPPGTRMLYGGRVYRYWRAPKAFKAGEVVFEDYPVEGEGSKEDGET